MMERALKERIIGAVVLVLVVVLVVPVFLDGPPDDGDIISEQVPLPGQADQDTKTVILDRDRSEPVPANGGAAAEPEAETPKPVPQPIVQQAQPEPAPTDKAPAESEPEPKEEQQEPQSEPEAAPVASQTGMWTVQLGSFSDQERAKRLAADLRSQGYAAFLSTLATSSGGKVLSSRSDPNSDCSR